MKPAPDADAGPATRDRPELDADLAKSGSQAGFITFFNGLPPAEPGTIRLFERNAGEYYSAHGDDAVFIARNLYRTEGVLKHLGSGPAALPSCTLSRANYVAFLSDALLVRQCRVHIYALVSTTPNSWKLARRASPGNLDAVQDDLPEISTDPVIVAVSLLDRPAAGEVVLGLAMANATDKSLAIAELRDNELLTNLEALLIRLGARECLVAKDRNTSLNSPAHRLNTVLAAANVTVSTEDKSRFTPLATDDLSRLLRSPLPPGTLDSQPAAARALGAVVSYLDLLADSTYLHEFTCVPLHTFGFMRLDAHAVGALDLFGDGPRRPAHLFGLLNHCITQPGSRLLAQWLRQPLADRTAIAARLELVEAITDSADARDSIRAFLRGLPDLPRLTKKLRRGKAALPDVVLLYQMAVRIAELLPALAHDQRLVDRFAAPVEQAVADLAEFIRLVEDMVDLDAVENHQFRVLPSVDPELMALHSQIAALEALVQPEAEKAARMLGLELHRALKVEHSSQHGYHLRVSNTQSNVLRSADKGSVIELTTLKSGVLFTTPALRRTSSKLLDLGSQYDAQQSAVVRELMASVAEHIPPFMALGEELSELDVLAAFAHAGLQAPVPYTKPTLNENKKLCFSGLRHPMVEVQPGMHFIANDVAMARDDGEFLIVSGPNMGGKSTYARSIALASLMAQVGCFVPATSATVPIFDAIHCRIGASDNAARGVSTFMAEMLETAAILRSATAHSLVIMDELGRGTSTHDGFGLAWAISHHLATATRCFALFATHFHELTELATQLPNRVKNLHVTAYTPADGGTAAAAAGASSAAVQDVTLLYKVAPGASDRSFGIHVAELAGFPPSVLALARRKLAELEGHSGTKKRAAAADDGGEERAAKRIARDFLREFGAIDLDASDARAKVAELHQRFAPRVAGNTALAELVAEFSAKG
ncbi:MSH2 protein [Blastocladiella emersonii ATCC 22665]|nr:MSH2 protein [Blastocladiella emersonii ATCC 22665]